MKKFKVLFLITVCMSIFPITALYAQDDEGWNYTAGADIVSGYLWRGQHLANFSAQPEASFGYAKNDWAFSAGAWASVPFNHNDYYEIDFFVEGSWKGLGLSVSNYAESGFFAPYNDCHYLDIGLSYCLGDPVPLTFSWYTIFAGDDYRARHQRAFSSYAELSFDFSLWVIDFTASGGFVPFFSPYYGVDKFAVTSLALRAAYNFKEVPVMEGSMVFIGGVYNPHADRFFFEAGFGYHF